MKKIFNSLLLGMFLIPSFAQSAEECAKLIPTLPVKPVCNGFDVKGLEDDKECTEETIDSTSLKAIEKIHFSFLDRNQKEYVLLFEGHSEPNRITLIIHPQENMTVQAGYITLTSNALLDNSIDIEIYLDSSYQGKAIGPTAIKLLLEKLKEMNLKTKYIIQIVAKENVASLSMNNKLSPDLSCQYVRYPAADYGTDHQLFLYDLHK